MTVAVDAPLVVPNPRVHTAPGSRFAVMGCGATGPVTTGSCAIQDDALVVLVVEVGHRREIYR
jgi:hypothetical protein